MKLFKQARIWAVGLLALAGCFHLMNSALAGEQKNAPGGAGAATAGRVQIKDFMFEPAALAVTAGTRVTFVNRDDEPHVVASKDGKFARSKPLDTGDEFSVTLATPGQYAYFCTVHPQMIGTITVTAP